MDEPFASLLRQLSEIKNTLNELVKTITEYQKSDAQQRKEEVEAQSETVVRLPEQITKFYESEERERTVENCREVVRMGLEAAAVAAAFVLAILTFCSLRALNGQLRQMQMETKIQRETGINAERAWIGLDNPITISGITVKGDTVAIKGYYSIKNFGHGPAVKVIQSSDFVGDPSNLNITANEAQFRCDSSVKFATGTVPMVPPFKQPGAFGYTLFPNQAHSETIDYTGPATTLRFFQFIGCVAYIDQFKAVHWTRFCMQRRPGDPAPIPRLDFCSLFNDSDDSDKPQDPPQKTN